jgi:FMN reductase
MGRAPIIGIGGSTAPTCSSTQALNFALQSAERAGARTRLLSIRELNLPLYMEGEPSVPDSARLLAEEVQKAHGLIWASPLYHGTVSGAFKNTIDWLQLLAKSDPPYLTNKVIGLIATAGGTQGLQAINTMEYMVRALRGWTVPLVAPIPHAYQAFDEQGQPLQARDALLLEKLGVETFKGAQKMAVELVDFR